MAYPASTKTLQAWVQEVDQKAGLLKAAAEQQKALSLASNLDMYQVRGFFDTLVQCNVFFVSASAVTGLASYLNTEKGGVVADPVAEFTAMRNAVVSVLDWLRTNVPGGTFDGNNYKLAVLFPAGNSTSSSFLKFTAAQTATYRTVLDTLIGTVS